MAWTQSDLDALEAAMKSGALTVHFADRTVTYHSLKDLIELRALMRDSIRAGAPGSATDRASFVKTSKG